MRIVVFNYDLQNNAIAGIVYKKKIICKFMIFFNSETVRFIKCPKIEFQKEVIEHLELIGFTIGNNISVKRKQKKKNK